MKPHYLFMAVAIVFLLSAGTYADDKPTVEVVVGPDETTKSDTIAADVPKVYASFKVTGAKPGDKLRGAWVAEDVGTAAPKETKIDEATVPVDKADITGTFSLSKPTKGWPMGKYRIDIYLNDTLTSTAKFTIATAEKPAEEPKS